MSFKDTVTADRRLMILRALAVTTGYGANRSLLQCFLDAGGHKVSGDLLAGDIAWLEEMGVVTTRDDAVVLTERGGDVAAGRSTVPGIRALRPGE